MEITKPQFNRWVSDALAYELTRRRMITASGTVSGKDLTRLKHMNFVISSKEKTEAGFKVTLTRVTSVWPGLVDRLRSGFGGLQFTDSEESVAGKGE